MRLRTKTWMFEAAFVAATLVAVTLITRGPVREWVGSVGVILTFMHAQVSERMAERDASRATPSVGCSWLARWYFIGREAAWFAYFVMGHSWSALVGCGVFMAYPAWRSWWRRRHPLAAEHAPTRPDALSVTAAFISPTSIRDPGRADVYYTIRCTSRDVDGADTWEASVGVEDSASGARARSLFATLVVPAGSPRPDTEAALEALGGAARSRAPIATT